VPVRSCPVVLALSAGADARWSCAVVAGFAAGIGRSLEIGCAGIVHRLGIICGPFGGGPIASAGIIMAGPAVAGTITAGAAAVGIATASDAIGGRLSVRPINLRWPLRCVSARRATGRTCRVHAIDGRKMRRCDSRAFSAHEGSCKRPNLHVRPIEVRDDLPLILEYELRAR
jgi:hypothetical protein